MNPVNRRFAEVRKICRSEIIEIGASMLDENLNEISSFRIYVRPQYNEEIVPYCSRLTGITMDRLFCADHFPEALRKFVQWCGTSGDDFTVYAWSDSDLIQLREQIGLYGTEITAELQYILDNWNDFQKEYCPVSSGKKKAQASTKL